MDMSLDDFISKKKISYPSRGGRGARRGGGGRPNGTASRPRPSRPAGGMRNGSMFGSGTGPVGRWMHDMYQGGGVSRSRPQPLMGSVPAGPVKLLVTNLDYKVSDSDIRELFGEFGNMTSASIHYDSSGCSLGSAQVMYTNRASATRAKQQYNGVHLDGRPMNISMEGETAVSKPMVSRPMTSSRVGMGGGVRRPMGGAPRRGSGGGTRGGRGGSRGGGRSADKPNKSAEELDKELDKYLEEAKSKK